MTTLKDKVISAFQKTSNNSVPYYATNTESHLQELSEAIVELVKLDIHPKFKEVTSEFIEVEFVPIPEQKLTVGKVVKFKEHKEIKSEYKLNDKWFVKEVRDLVDGHEVILNQFVEDKTVAVALYDETLEALTDSFVFIH